MKAHGQWIKSFYRWMGHHVARFAHPTPLTANGLTLLRLPAILGASWLVARSTGRFSLVLAAFLVFLFSMLDAADGELAKRKGTSIMGAWIDIQIDQVGFLVLFIALAWRLSWVPGGGTGWVIASLAALGMLQTLAQLPWFLRFKSVFDPIREGVQSNREGPAKVGRDPLWAVFKQQVRPHYHNYSLIVIAGLLLGSAKVAVAVLLAYTGSWWLWTALRVARAAARHDAQATEK